MKFTDHLLGTRGGLISSTVRQVGIAAALAGSCASAAEVTLPHTFSAGTPARATEVNANFSAVEAAIDDNARVIAELRAQVQALQAAAGSLNVTVSGARVGAFVTSGPDDPNFSISGVDIEGLLAVSDKGYFFEVSLGETYDGSPAIIPEGGLVPGDTYFTQAGCAGTKYLAFPYDRPGQLETSLRFMFRQGFVVAATNPGDVVKAYMAKGAPVSLSMFSVQSRTSAGAATCSNLPVAEAKRAVALVANDPGVTGVQNELAGAVQILVR